MKKRLWVKGAVYTLIFTTAIGSSTVYASEKEMSIESKVNPTTGQVTNKLFPEIISDSATINNCKEKFKAYRGQGSMYLTLNKVERAEVFVNGTPIDLHKYFAPKKVKTVKVDLSSIVKDGTNTVQVSNISPQGATIEVDIDYPTLREGMPESVGVDGEVFEVIDRLLKTEIKVGGIPGGQLLVAKNGVIIKNATYGAVKAYDQHGKVENKIPVTKNTLYDLASNTKMYATNYAVQKLVSEGKLKIEDRIADIIPNFDEFDSEKSVLTVKHLLTHTGGFIPDTQYHNENYLHPVTIDGKTVNLLDKNEDGKNDIYTQDKSKILEMIKKTPLEYVPGTKNVYSDVDYMLLGLIVEHISGQDLDKYCRENIFEPLGLTHTVFNPLKCGFNKNEIAATELFGNTREGHITFNHVRKEVVQGEVHDEKAFYTMNGVSGHAGLFSTASDLAILMQVMLNGGGYGQTKLFDQKTIDRFVIPSETNDTYGLGWRRQGKGGYAWAFGKQAPDATIGHTGWTGTSTSIDPQNDLIIVWLSNTKNTPIADVTKSLNRMEGDAFQFDAAGTLSTLVYEGITGTSKETLEEAVLQMSLDRTAILIEEIQKDGNCTEADYKATVALVEVLVEKAEEAKKDKAEAIKRAKLAYNALPEHQLKQELSRRIEKLE